jgi:predicted enzyme related to lactoylglutathione lyase
MSTQTDFGLSSIGQIAVNAHDLDRAVAFYSNKLGMKHLFTVPNKMAFFDCNGISLMLGLPETPEFDHLSSTIYFNVDDIQKATDVLSARGVHFEERPAFVANMGSYDLWMAFFRDSEQNIMAMMSRIPH